MYHKKRYDAFMAKRGNYPWNALDGLIPDYSRIVRDLEPAMEFMRRNEEIIRQLTSNPTLEAIRHHEEAIRQLTSSPVIEELRRQEEMNRRLLEDPLLKAVHGQAEWLRQVTKIHGMLETPALSGMADEAKKIAEATAPWREMASRVTSSFDKLVPDTAFSEMQRIAETVRQAAPVMPAFDNALFTLNFDDTLAAAIEGFRERAQHIADDPEVSAADVEDLFERAAEITAAAPPQSRAAMNAYVKYLLLWLLGVLAEDPVQEGAKRVLATLLLFLSTLQPGELPDLPPAPPSTLTAPLLPAPSLAPSDIPHALTMPGSWQIEGLPDVIKRAGPQASLRTLEFFTTNISNPNTRAAYANAVMRFFNWCDDRDLELVDITPFTVVAYIQELQRETSAPTVKQHLAAIKNLFDWLVVGQILSTNPASSVRGPKHVVHRGKTPVLTTDQARHLLGSIDISDIAGLRDRALLGVMVYAFARVSAVTSMRVEDYFVTGNRWWFRLHEKDDKRHDVPAHHNAESYLNAYLESASIAAEKNSPLFRTLDRRRELSLRPMHRSDVLRMVYRRAKGAGLDVRACCHTFRATGITSYLENGGSVAKAQQIAAHESPRTTTLYDRRTDELTLEEIERIVI